VPSSPLASKMSEVADPGAKARKVFIRLVETLVSWGICVVQNVRVLMGIKPLRRQGPKFAPLLRVGLSALPGAAVSHSLPDRVMPKPCG
jgi:hypothetical protein